MGKKSYENFGGRLNQSYTFKVSYTEGNDTFFANRRPTVSNSINLEQYVGLEKQLNVKKQTRSDWCCPLKTTKICINVKILFILMLYQ